LCGVAGEVYKLLTVFWLLKKAQFYKIGLFCVASKFLRKVNLSILHSC